MKRVLVCVATLSVAACSWGIKLDSAGSKVRVAWNADVSACRDLGKVTVSVLDRLGPMDRNRVKVNDELEVMARNEAAQMNADTIKPLSEVRNGEQSWGAYSCGGNIVNEPASRPRSQPDSNGVETFPIKGD
jgi:hypothetical protein